MPGTVLLVHVSDGDTVSAGDVLVVLESMKMELAIAAPHDGVVDGLSVKPGDRVALHQTLLAVSPASDGRP
jgi:biotin carboxyl carrier protein